MVGPDYKKPKVEAPAAFKESEGWKVAQPQDEIPRGKWWEMFNDPQLNALEEQVDVSNQTMQWPRRITGRRGHWCRGRARRLFPTVGVDPAVTRSSQSSYAGSEPVARGVQHGLLRPGGGVLGGRPVGPGPPQRRIHRTSAQASAGDLETARLAMQAELAQDYFQLRALDAEKQLLGSHRRRLPEVAAS